MPRFTEFIRELIRFQHRTYQLFTTDWMQRWVRSGHAAKGMLYGAIGFVSMRSVVYDSESAGGSQAAG
jgi:hypothetical protein